MTASARILEVSNLTVRYGRIAALVEVDIDVGEGEMVCLLGANGAGKSSLLNSVAGLVPSAEGKIAFRGSDVTDLACHRRNHAGIALSPEGRRILADLTVGENLRLAAARIERSRQGEKIDEILDLFPVLSKKIEHSGGFLSGGEQQQLAIGRALLSEPALLLLDEPSLGLDPINTAKIFESLGRLKESGLSILLAEQNVTRALELADRAYVLETGRVTISERAVLLSGEEVEEAYLGLAADQEGGD